jgi:hypothetical protein
VGRATVEPYDRNDGRLTRGYPMKCQMPSNPFRSYDTGEPPGGDRARPLLRSSSRATPVVVALSSLDNLELNQAQSQRGRQLW